MMSEPSALRYREVSSIAGVVTAASAPPWAFPGWPDTHGCLCNGDGVKDHLEKNLCCLPAGQGPQQSYFVIKGKITRPGT